jgi:hypothetical protein
MATSRRRQLRSFGWCCLLLRSEVEDNGSLFCVCASTQRRWLLSGINIGGLAGLLGQGGVWAITWRGAGGICFFFKFDSKVEFKSKKGFKYFQTKF